MFATIHHNMKKIRIISLITSAILFITVSCATGKNLPSPHEPDIPQDLTLLFAGDIMAHTPNFNMKDYDKIWEAVSSLVSSCDLSFANIESPVMDSKSFSSYPDFNMQAQYPQAAINAGFNVFSIVNNHSNDQGLEGIEATREWSKNIQTQYKTSPRPLFFSGIRDYKNGEFTYQKIDINGWTVLFCAVTELLNRNTYTEYLNYVPSTEKSRTKFKEFLKKLKDENNCDLFILSVHSDEAEYIADVNDARKKYYLSLLECGVDIVWANHPHVVRDWQTVGSETDMIPVKLIMYGNGNTISAQRTKPQFLKPSTPRDDTGDGLLLKVTFSKRGENGEIPPFIKKSEPYFITTYINENREFIIKYLDSEFISELTENENTKWASYLKERKIITERHKDNPIWQ